MLLFTGGGNVPRFTWNGQSNNAAEMAPALDAAHSRIKQFRSLAEAVLNRMLELEATCCTAVNNALQPKCGRS